MYEYILGLDLGQARDFTALTVIQKSDNTEETKAYDLISLKRYPLGTSYPKIVENVNEIMNREELKEKSSLVADATGVGRPVIDLLKTKDLRPVGITITGGTEVSVDSNGYYKVPKKDLISQLLILLETERLKIIPTLDLAQTLITEILNFKVKITESAHDTYESGREGIHDDLVLAAALACWYGERRERFSWRPLETTKEEKKKEEDVFFPAN